MHLCAKVCVICTKKPEIQLVTFTECSLNEANFLTFHPNYTTLMTHNVVYAAAPNCPSYYVFFF